MFVGVYGGIWIVRYKVICKFLHNTSMFDDKFSGCNILAFYKLMCVCFDVCVLICVCVLVWYVSV